MLKKWFKSREYYRAEYLLKKINALKASIHKLSDQKLIAKTIEFKQKLKQDPNLDKILVEVFAVAREATWRKLKKWLFDVQIIGAIILHDGAVIEMKTGEGKTIATIPTVYLNALLGKGVVVATVNEYLAQRDAIETGLVHNFLGLTVGTNLKSYDQDQKRDSYAANITYSTHSELGFDYLRDNMVSRIEEKVQLGFNFCIIDEVDSILIDEARTPLIITGGEPILAGFYLRADQFVKSLKPSDYDIDWESKGIQLTNSGINKANKFYQTKNIFSLEHSETIHRIQNALCANYVMALNADYIVKDKKIELIDAFTGRIMVGRSYSEGLQQAIQAKERVKIEDETKTLATITYQNFFRMYTKLSGMTGTAKTEENEFIDIYNIRVIVIPTNEPMIRVDKIDNVYVSKEAKYQAIVAEIQKVHQKKQPILIGTTWVEQSEKLSRLLKKNNIPHHVLNAKQDAHEAEIIAAAGRNGAVTIATNMAGRGTDIQLDEFSKKNGGLYVLGTNRAEARRIDNQLRGRSGRQGDTGVSKFFLSLDDSLITRFSAQAKLKKNFQSFGDQPIISKYMSKALTRAQKKIEGFNYDIRKNVLQYDDVIRQQRNAIYNQRDIIISLKELYPLIERMLKKVTSELLAFPQFLSKDNTIDCQKLVETLNLIWFAKCEKKLTEKDLINLHHDEIYQSISKKAIQTYRNIREKIIAQTSKEDLCEYERDILLQTFDANWQLHIDHMDKLRSSSSLSSYAQKNPFQVFTEKGIELFNNLIQRISHNAIKTLMNIEY